MNLFPDQERFVADLREALRHHKSVLAHAATGFGKTVVSAYIAKSASDLGKRVTFAVHRRNLLTQSARTFAAFGINYGFIAAGYRAMPHYPVQIASIETLRRRLAIVPRTDLLYIDECHLACSRTWSEVIDHFRERGARVIGNTATPARLDGRPLSRHFEAIVSGPPVAELIAAGRLSGYRMFAPTQPDLSEVHTRGGEYVTAELEVVMDTAKIIGDAAEHYHKLMSGRRAIAFFCSIAASQHGAEQFRAAGIPAAHMDGETPEAERQSIIRDFADGRTNVLCNVDLVTTGFDLSAQVGRDVPVEGGIFLRPTQSLALWLQMVGRCLRKKDQAAVLADHAGNALVHGLPDDDFEWSLDGRQRAKKAAAPGLIALRNCPAPCFAVFRASLAACPACGMEYRKAGRNAPETVDGTLSELSADDQRRLMIRKKRDVAVAMRAAKTLEEHVVIAQRFGYKAGWAAFAYGRKSGDTSARNIGIAQRIWRELANNNGGTAA